MTNRWLKTADRVLGNLIMLVLGFRLGKQKPVGLELPDSPRILMIKTIGIGDVVAILPAVKAIRKRYPQAHLTFLAMPRVKEVLEGSELIDEVVYLDFKGVLKGMREAARMTKELRQSSYDLSIDFEHYYNFTALMAYFARIPRRVGFVIPGQKRREVFTHAYPYPVEAHETDAFMVLARGIGAEGDTDLVPISYSDEDEAFIGKLLQEKGIQPSKLVLVHPGTSPSAMSRRWPEEYFVQVIKELQTQGFQVGITGSEGDRPTIQKVLSQSGALDLVGRTTLKQFAVLAGKAALVLSVDTGPMHVAAATGTPVVGVFGPNIPSKWGPKGPENVAVIEKLECSPCTRQYLGVVSTCEDPRCMRELRPEKVIDACLGILRAK